VFFFFLFLFIFFFLYIYIYIYISIYREREREREKRDEKHLRFIDGEFPQRAQSQKVEEWHKQHRAEPLDGLACHQLPGYHRGGLSRHPTPLTI